MSINVWNMFARGVLKEDPPMLFGYAAIVVVSGSMEPAFAAGDLLIIKKKDRYFAGDAVTFADGGSLVTHRIEGVSDRGFVTRGDNNNTDDLHPVPQSDIRGAVVSILPGFGSALLFVKSPAGIAAMIAVTAAVVFVPEVSAKLLKRRKERAE